MEVTRAWCIQKHNAFCQALQSVTEKHSPSTNSNMTKYFYYIVIYSHLNIPVLKELI